MYIGIDLGGTNCQGVLCDESLEVVGESLAPTPKGTDATPRAMTETIAKVIMDLQNKSGTQEPLPVGLGIPGLVDTDGRLSFGPNLDHIAGYDVGREVIEFIGPRQIYVDNDANCHARAETRLGGALGADNALMVMFGTGIGGGLVLDGCIYRGAHGFAGEIGHIQVDAHGSICACGRVGCWETVASGRALAVAAREQAMSGRLRLSVQLAGGDPLVVRGEHVSEAADNGDDDALAVMRTLGQNISIGLANLVQIFDPDLIVLGGGVLRAAAHLLAPVEASLAERLRSPIERPHVKVVAATLGHLAGAIGACSFVKDA